MPLESLAVVSFLHRARRIYSGGRDVGYSSLQRSYGPLAAILFLYLPFDIAAQHGRVERILIEDNDEHTLGLRQAVTDECNMTAIAGAIIAQVAITALSLPNLSSTHWVARAFFLFAVASGCMSVYFSCVVQRTIGTRYNPESIRDWLSLPPKEKCDGDSTRKASLAAVVIISAPFNMMKGSIGAFLLGLAIYQGFIWTRGLDTNAGLHDSRDVFIAFIVGILVCTLSYWLTLSLKSAEDFVHDIWERLDVPDPVPLNTVSGLVESPSIVHEPKSSPQALRGGMVSQHLAATLEAAAQAHQQCAEADRRVASVYAVASSQEIINVIE